MESPVIEAHENTARHAQNQSSHTKKNRLPARTPSSPQQVAPDTMLFDDVNNRRPQSRWTSSPQQVAPDTMLFTEVNNRMKSFEGPHSKLFFKANEALQDASTVSWMLTCIKQLMSTQSTGNPETPLRFPVTPLLSPRSYTRPRNAQNPVGCSSSPKLREKIDSVETLNDKYFGEAKMLQRTQRPYGVRR